MDSSSFDEPGVGSELERFILSHAALKPGDKLEGKVIQVKPRNRVLIHFRKFRAPRVAAKGRGHIADKIIEVAKEHNIPLHEDKEMVQVLDALDLDTEIPGELFRAAAEVLAFIYRMNKKI